METEADHPGIRRIARAGIARGSGSIRVDPCLSVAKTIRAHSWNSHKTAFSSSRKCLAPKVIPAIPSHSNLFGEGDNHARNHPSIQ